MSAAKYTEDSIRSLDWKEHIRFRPGMYIGKLGDGSSQDDGIYVLLKEVIDNSIDEFAMGFGKAIDITIKDKTVTIRDYGRGIPLGKVQDAVAKMNTGAKYDSEVFKKSVGLNGVGTKAVNALSSYFKAQSVREKKTKVVEFKKGDVLKDHNIIASNEADGTIISFQADDTIFPNYHYLTEHVERMLWNYAFLNAGLKIRFNGAVIESEKGLHDLLEHNINSPILYPIIHLKGHDIELAMTHSVQQYSEEYYSFVNCQHTTQGGTHLNAFREAIVKTIREFYKKNFEAADIRKSIVAAISVKVEEPIFESQTKTKLGSQDMGPKGPSIRTYIGDFIKTELDNYLHKNEKVAEELLQKIVQSEEERKALSGIQKLARERAKKAGVHNRKLRDCRVHYNDNNERRLETTLFITEGDSASGSITKARDPNIQGVFSLKGKPLNTYGLTKKIVYENEEFSLLQSALNIEENVEENLRYNNVVIATDADVDGMHIRLLLMTFFLQFFPDLVKNGHLYILETPLFRVRNKKETIYCYSEEEKINAIKKLGGKPEITRFKGLGEISPDEFKFFIGKDIRLQPVIIGVDTKLEELMNYYMGKNTPERQEFIINHLKVEKEEAAEALAAATE